MPTQSSKSLRIQANATAVAITQRTPPLMSVACESLGVEVPRRPTRVRELFIIRSLSTALYRNILRRSHYVKGCFLAVVFSRSPPHVHLRSLRIGKIMPTAEQLSIVYKSSVSIFPPFRA